MITQEFVLTLLLFVAWGLLGWLTMAQFISVVLHRAIAHRAIELPQWWMLMSFWLANGLFFHVNPQTWVADHRMHHAYSDTEKDPDKHPEDTFWVWLIRFFRHNPSPSEPLIQKFSKDDIFHTWTARFWSSKAGEMTSHVTSFGAAYLVFRSVWWALAFWVTIRLAGLCVLMLQSYFGHGSHVGAGYRNYELDDFSANLPSRLAQFLTAGECLQNNHHAQPRRASHAHLPHEWDPGYNILQVLVLIGLAKVPEQRPLPEHKRATS